MCHIHVFVVGVLLFVMLLFSVEEWDQRKMQEFRGRDQKATRKERVMLDVDEREDDDEIRDDGADKEKKVWSDSLQTHFV